jgi:2-hydroxychromene-2-carboxylate isomerase
VSAQGLPDVGHVVIYGDFDCPWSYLASRRAAVLSTHGVRIDWRAVEHSPHDNATGEESGRRFEDLRIEMEEVEALLLPGEQLPFALAGFLPHTRAAIVGYAEACATGGAVAAVRDRLFEALWLHSVDLGDGNVVHTLVVDAIGTERLSGELSSPGVHDAGATGDSIRTTAAQLAATWEQEWRAVGHGVVPVMLLNGVVPLLGVDGVTWLGQELLDRQRGSEAS